VSRNVIGVDQALRQLVDALVSLEDASGKRDDRAVWVGLNQLHKSTHQKAAAPSSKAVAEALTRIGSWVSSAATDEFFGVLEHVLDGIAHALEHRVK